MYAFMNKYIAERLLLFLPSGIMIRNTAKNLNIKSPIHFKNINVIQQIMNKFEFNSDHSLLKAKTLS